MGFMLSYFLPNTRANFMCASHFCFDSEIELSEGSQINHCGIKLC